MSKAILIIDMPEKCSECKFYRVGNCGYEDCFLTRKSVFSENRNKREDWCPLKEIPKRKPLNPDPYYTGKSDIYNFAWNSCIDEILKESD